MLPAALLLLIASATAFPTEGNHHPHDITWTTCPTSFETPSPIDWSNPLPNQSTGLALAKAPARNITQRIGTLLFNTGGPGQSAIEELIGNGTGFIPFSDTLRDRFDIVAIDPRGVGCSDQIFCDAGMYNEVVKLTTFPTTEDEFEQQVVMNRRFVTTCSCPLVTHSDSRTAAQDFEAVRIALGDEPLNYIGLSYGSMIGTAYLELFPHNIRSMVLDGNVDHSQLQPYAVLTEARAYEDVLTKFFAWCDEDESCAVHNTTLTTAKLWEDLIARAEREALPAPACAGTSSCLPTVSASDLILNAQQYLTYKPPLQRIAQTLSWQSFAQNLHDAYHNHNATAFSIPIADSTTTFASLATTCGDFPPTLTFSDLLNLQLLLNTTTPLTRGLSTSHSILTSCLGWPYHSSNPPHVPFIRDVSTTVLQVNALWDPETSFDWAVALGSEIPGARLLARRGVGHTSWGLMGEAFGLMEGYLVEGVVPGVGRVVDS
ncbi:hypothetical protein PRZ48_008597 [Zasmidium cellare]|uniref:AB hydrolase-1 domain-containing protein n=1 Tax=Zasmidium cellare TaxID=395010 RepID=A0ABR0EH54_ZASCE|nr:hypothetical protein PRZ48_008597 [Zasmidium cellare]